MTDLLTTLGLILLAELGDKSLLVCMLLASRHKKLPVIMGAVSAFALLNLLAVTVGASLAHWIDFRWSGLVAGLLFLGFGVQTLRQAAQSEDMPEEKSHGSVLVTTFLMIFLAELGDKTQLAVALLATTSSAAMVWSGATLALTITSSCGVFFGKWLSQRVDMTWIHRLSGMSFILVGGWLLWEAVLLFTV